MTFPVVYARVPFGKPGGATRPRGAKNGMVLVDAVVDDADLDTDARAGEVAAPQTPGAPITWGTVSVSAW